MARLLSCAPCALLTLFLTLWGTSLLGKQIPEPYTQAITLDQSSNIRHRHIMTPAEREVVPIYHFDVPIEKAPQIQSAFLDSDTRKHVYIYKGRATYVRFFVVDNGVSNFEVLKAHGVNLESGDYFGTKVQSHNTYFIWNEKDPSLKPIYIKLPYDNPGHPGVLAENLSYMGVRHNDAVERLLQEEKDGFISVLPERFAATTRVAGITYTVNIRRPDPARPAGDGKTNLLPLHGLLGSKSLIAEYAGKRGLSPEQWMTQEYLAKLGKAEARLHFKYGLYPEGHTQNMLVQIDPQTGEIKGFVLRDLPDMMFDPLPRLGQGLPLHQESIGDAGASRLYDYFLDPAAPEASAPGYHWGAYDAQSVFKIDKASQRTKRLRTLAYLESYLHEAEAVSGHPIALSPDGQKALASLRRRGTHYYLESTKWGKVRAAAMTVIQDIYRKVTDGYLPRLTPEMENYKKSTLHQIFFAHAASEEVGWLSPNAYQRISGWRSLFTRIGYAYDGKGILVYLRGTGEPLAYAFNLSGAEKAALKAARLRPGILARAASCVWGFLRLGTDAEHSPGH